MGHVSVQSDQNRAPQRKLCSDRVRGALTVVWLLLLLPIFACGRRSHEDPLENSILPFVGETDSVSITVHGYDAVGGVHTDSCEVDDVALVRDLIDCLTPPVPLDPSLGFFDHEVPSGRLEFKGVRGVKLVDFLEMGKRPLLFRVNRKQYSRGGSNYKLTPYRGYVSDHIRLYGVDSPEIDGGNGGALSRSERRLSGWGCRDVSNERECQGSFP